MNAKSVSTYDERDINVDREREGAGREPLCFSVCADLAFHIVSNSASQLPLLQASRKFAHG